MLGVVRELQVLGDIKQGVYANNIAQTQTQTQAQALRHGLVNSCLKYKDYRADMRKKFGENPYLKPETIDTNLIKWLQNETDEWLKGE